MTPEIPEQRFVNLSFVILEPLLIDQQLTYNRQLVTHFLYVIYFRINLILGTRMKSVALKSGVRTAFSNAVPYNEHYKYESHKAKVQLLLAETMHEI